MHQPMHSNILATTNFKPPTDHDRVALTPPPTTHKVSEDSRMAAPQPVGNCHNSAILLTLPTSYDGVMIPLVSSFFFRKCAPGAMAGRGVPLVVV